MNDKTEISKMTIKEIRESIAYRLNSMKEAIELIEKSGLFEEMKDSLKKGKASGEKIITLLDKEKETLAIKMDTELLRIVIVWTISTDSFIEASSKYLRGELEDVVGANV